MTRPIFARGLGTSPRGPQGLPGINAVPAKDAVDAYNAALIADPASATSTELVDSIAQAIGDGTAAIEVIETALRGAGAGPKVGDEAPTAAGSTHLHGTLVNAGSAATVPSRVATFRTRFDTALSGRQVEFYILRPGPTGTFTPTYASGLVDAATTGVVTWNTAQGTTPDMAVGDVLGIWCSASSQGDAVRVAESGGNAIGDTYWDVVPADRLTVGVAKSSFDGGAHQTIWIVSLSATMVTGGLTLLTSENVGVYTSQSSQWVGKTISAYGTSIDYGTAAGTTGGVVQGYINQLAARLGCTVDNQAVGSSGIVWDGARALSLGATRTQLTAAGFDPNESYQTKVLTRTSDLAILGHGYNDRTSPIGTLADTSTGTFYGAYNTVIEAKFQENLDQQFMFLTPISAYSPTYESEGVENPQVLAIRTAILALGRKWGIPVLDWTFSLGINETTDDHLQPDNVHPTQVVHDRAARMLAAFIKTL